MPPPQSETLRKMLVAMSRDIRVLLIKLGDRLHNARTWRFVPQASAAKKAEETLKIYAPLAHRLGLNTIKWELEDLSFAAMSPEIYAEMVRMVGERTPALEKFLKRGAHQDYGPPERGGHRRDRDRPPQALLLDSSEDEDEGP